MAPGSILRKGAATSVSPAARTSPIFIPADSALCCAPRAAALSQVQQPAGHRLTTWRGARERGDLVGVPKKRGPVRRVADPRDKKLAEQEREISRWKKRAERAEALVELQKQVAALLGTPLATETS